jgi:hypothetical protein
MSKKSSLVALLGVFVGVLLLAGCPPRLKISDIQRDPGKYMNKEVTVAGRVDRAFGALGMGIFQVDDGTGKMWVLSESYGVPGEGANVGVTGTLIQTATFAGKSYSNVLRETRRRHS